MQQVVLGIPEEKHRRERYVTGYDELFESKPDMRSDEQEIVASAEQAAHRVNRLLEYLDPRERQIIRMRAGLDNHSEGMTLEKIGEQLGITKERVRQLNVRAMKKLRSLAENNALVQAIMKTFPGARLEAVRRKGEESSLVAGLGEEPPAAQEYPADDDIPESEY